MLILLFIFKFGIIPLISVLNFGLFILKFESDIFISESISDKLTSGTKIFKFPALIFAWACGNFNSILVFNLLRSLLFSFPQSFWFFLFKS